jgi:hypothetical protein
MEPLGEKDKWVCLLIKELDTKADVCPFVTAISFGSLVDQKSYKCALVDKGYYLFL